MNADQLLNELEAAGLTVKELPGWKTRGGIWATNNKPEGIMQHHTAAPVPYPPKRLADNNRIKANMNTKPDGTVWMIAYNACNYSSGPGSKVVLEENVRPALAPIANAKERGLADNYGGNRYFFNYENDHLGDGSSLPAVQFDAIVDSTRVVLNHFGLVADQVISHAEHTRRKVDPNWNGDNRTAINQIRTALGEDMPLSETDLEAIRETVREELDRELGGNPGPVSGFRGIGQAVVTTMVGRSGKNVGQLIQETWERVVNR